MNTLTNTEALELGRIFRKNGTGIDVVRKLALQYPHLSGHQLTNVATAWDKLQSTAPPVTETAVSNEVDPDKMQRAVAFAATVNAAEAKPLATASAGDLHALIAAYFA
jgi:hypothetical protein